MSSAADLTPALLIDVSVSAHVAHYVVLLAVLLILGVEGFRAVLRQNVEAVVLEAGLRCLRLRLL